MRHDLFLAIPVHNGTTWVNPDAVVCIEESKIEPSDEDQTRCYVRLLDGGPDIHCTQPALDLAQVLSQCRDRKPEDEPE